MAHFCRLPISSKLLQALLGVLVLCLLSQPLHGQRRRELKQNPLAGGPAQMHTTQTSAKVWLMVWKSYNIKAWIEVNGEVQEEVFELHDNDWTWGFSTLILDFHNLEPGAAYPLRLVVDGKSHVFKHRNVGE